MSIINKLVCNAHIDPVTRFDRNIELWEKTQINAELSDEFIRVRTSEVPDLGHYFIQVHNVPAQVWQHRDALMAGIFWYETPETAVLGCALCSGHAYGQSTLDADKFLCKKHWDEEQTARARKPFTMPELMDGYVPDFWYVVCQVEGMEREVVCKGSKSQVQQYMESILNEEGMERFTVPGYSGQIFERNPSCAWDTCWQQPALYQVSAR